MATVSLRAVSKSYPGSFPAVRDLSFEIREGEFAVLVGPSGCGKSTTLRLIAGLESPDAGDIHFDSVSVLDRQPRDRDIAMVFQNYALYPHMTVRENMAFSLRLRGVARAQTRERVERVAAMLDISELLDRRPGQLSGGQKQRVAVGRAIVREPRVFLLDEPLSNLDARLRLSTRAELKALHQRLRVTTIYVTHDQEEAMTLADRVAVMDAGRVRQFDAPMRLYRFPADRFVAGFIGSPAMNFIPGSLSHSPSAVHVFAERPAGWSIPIPALAPMPAAAGTSQKCAEVVLGFRPSALRVALDPVPQASHTASGRAAANLPLRVLVVEPLGDQADITGLTPAGARVVARVPVDSLPSAFLRDGFRPDEATPPLSLELDPAALYLFAPGSHGERLWPTAPEAL